MGTERVRNSGKSWCYCEKCLTWDSPIVVVPKRTAPGEPPKRRLCVDYRAINSRLPPCEKGFFQGQRNIDIGTITQNR